MFRFEPSGKYNFSTGTSYEGELKDGMFHGKGTLYFENGGKYEANWIDGIATDVHARHFCLSSIFLFIFLSFQREHIIFQTV